MPTTDFSVPQDKSLDSLYDYMYRLERTLRYIINGQLDSENAREFGGWRVGEDYLQSIDGDVGMSTVDTGADDIRFWAGNATKASAPFRVYESGNLVATDAEITGQITATSGTIGGWTIGATKLSGSGIIEGGTVTTGASGVNRIEMSSNSLKTITSSNNIQGIAWGDDVSGTTYGDVFLYDAGTKVLVFQNDLSGAGYTMKAVGTASMRLGDIGQTNFLSGSWEATNLQANTFAVRDGTDFETISQSNSTAATLADLVTDFNTLLANLRSLNILA